MTLTQNFLALIEGHRRWLLLAQLVILHLVLVQDVASPIARTLLVGHVGLFLLWQPIVRAERRLSLLEVAVIGAAVVAAALWANHWLLIGWVMVLAGIIGGKVFFSDSRAMRLFYLLALAYLVLALLVLLTPRVIPRPVVLPDAIQLLANVGLPAVFGVMALVPLRSTDVDHGEVIDFLYSIFVVLLLAVLVLGTLALMLLTSKEYVESLVTTLVAISVVLFFLGWAWNPRARFSGLSLVLSRYVLSVGLPFEDWLREMTELSGREPDPAAYLGRACASLARFPGVAGGQWSAEGLAGRFGSGGQRRYAFSHGTLQITLHVQGSLGPALVWHFHLLVQVLGEFYLAKARARQLQQLSYLQAVHETGARLTHDVKNLLQSLNTLCFAAEREGEEASPRFQALLRRQLPVITRRLQTTLEKLRQPAGEEQEELSAQAWWDNAMRHYQQGRVRFFALGMREDCVVPAGLFDSALENLIENALCKQPTTGALAVTVTLDLTRGVALSVCDSGAPIPAAIAADLFKAPVPSEAGLGIGLYQLARQAESYGYRLAVAANDPGQVCIVLEKREGLEAKAGSHD
jgi:signal transduction histidine kinase